MPHLPGDKVHYRIANRYVGIVTAVTSREVTVRYLDPTTNQEFTVSMDHDDWVYVGKARREKSGFGKFVKRVDSEDEFVKRMQESHPCV